MQPEKKYSIQIANISHFERAIYKSVLFYDELEICFFENDKRIKRVSLSPSRISFDDTLKAAKDKVSLICQRLGINEQSLEYDKSALSLLEKLHYKFLFLLKMLYKMFIPMQWVIVYKKTDPNASDVWHKIIPPKEIFQADPFIVFKDNKYYVFYEELKFENYHGYLAVAELDIAQGKLINAMTIMKHDYHLSYPFVFEEGGCFYMIPESSEGHSIDLYKCTSFPYEWKKKKTLLSNIQAVDTTLLKQHGHWYLFTSEKVTGADFDDELSIYKSNDLLNQSFKKLYDQPVVCDVRNARMAGKFITKNGEIYRVSQDAGKRYGFRTNVNRVIQVENGYTEERIESIKPGSMALGFHTYNEDNGIAVGDQLIARFDYYSLRRFIGSNLKRIFKR